MSAYLVALICVCALMGEMATAESNSEAWRRFKRQHGKVYEPKEEAMRFANFLATKQRVDRHNANPDASYKMGLNYMADWDPEEYEPDSRRMTEAMNLLESLRSKSSPSPMMAKLMDDPEPKEVDWRKVPNRVSPVGDQKSCKSHGAFAVAGLLEGQEVTRNISKLIPLSVQEMIDCARYDNYCDDGYMSFILYSFSEDYFSFESEADYPYEARKKSCRLDNSKWLPNMLTKGPDFIPMGNEKALMRFVANHGPVAVSIDARANFHSYHSGVFSDNNCTTNPWYGYYCALVVGYGTDPKEGDYWIIKNSRGVNWGEEGYMRIKRGVNMCGIANFGTYSKF